MAIPKVYIDNVLLNWGDSLFYPPVRRIKNVPSKSLNWVKALILNKPQEIRSQIKRTVSRTPEVMVKITSRMNAGKGMLAIGKHLDYISRNGKIELEDQEGRLINGRADVKDVKNDWGDNIPDVSPRRESINVIFSMGKGTPAGDVKNAVREYLKEEFGGKHEYVFALHTDTDNPHVHVCIKMAPIHKKNKRLNPRKNDLQRWREGFAENLRKFGIDANATPRKTRGVTLQPLHQYQIHKYSRENLQYPRRSIVPNFQNYKKENAAWANIANALSKSDDRNDRALAKDVTDFMIQQPIQNQTENKKLHVEQQLEILKPEKLLSTTTIKEKIDDQYNIKKYRAALYQSNYSSIKEFVAAKSINSMRNLSSSSMVHVERGSKMLLLKNAPHYLDARRISNTSVRREGAGISSDGNGTLEVKNPRK